MEYLAMKKLLLMGAALAAFAAAQNKNSDVKNGERLYLKNGCFQCHGYAGQGGLNGARLAQTKLTAPGFTAFVRNPPSGGMPPYRAKVMSDQELLDVYTYIQTFPAPKPASEIPLLKD
jgi:ubiquinol-cytochrome c reductase cytochrome c subunit